MAIMILLKCLVFLLIVNPKSAELDFYTTQDIIFFLAYPRIADVLKYTKSVPDLNHCIIFIYTYICIYIYIIRYS